MPKLPADAGNTSGAGGTFPVAGTGCIESVSDVGLIPRSAQPEARALTVTPLYWPEAGLSSWMSDENVAGCGRSVASTAMKHIAVGTKKSVNISTRTTRLRTATEGVCGVTIPTSRKSPPHSGQTSEVSPTVL